MWSGDPTAGSPQAPQSTRMVSRDLQSAFRASVSSLPSPSRSMPSPRSPRTMTSPRVNRQIQQAEAELAYAHDARKQVSSLPSPHRVIASSNAGLMGVFRSSLSFPPKMEALVLREKKEMSGIYGIGLKIDSDPPHTVQKVHELVDAHGNNCNHRVAVGDILTFVDDAPIDKTVCPVNLIPPLITPLLPICRVRMETATAANLSVVLCCVA